MISKWSNNRDGIHQLFHRELRPMSSSSSHFLFRKGLFTSVMNFFFVGLSAWGADMQGISSMDLRESGWSRFQGKWNLEAGGESFDEVVDQGTLVGFIFRSRVQYRLTDQLDLSVDAKLQMVTRQIQARFADSRQTGIVPYEAVVRFHPGEAVELKVGALNMGFLKTPLLISIERSFPGASELVQWENENKSYLRAIASQTIPTSASFESMRAEREAVPGFFTETLMAGTNFADTFELSAQLTHFRFTDLPSVVAYESERLGNRTNGEFPANSRFRTQFAGWVTGGELCFCRFQTAKFKLGGYQIDNQQAPLSYNRGQELVARADLSAFGYVFSPYYLRFYSEQDVVPAFYNSGSRGHNNRQGDGVGLEVLFSPHNFRVVGELIQSDLINPNSEQHRLTSFQVRLETLNVEF